jgi:phosphoserine phosphatase
MEPVALPRATTAAVLERLEAELARTSVTPVILAFDADGTLWDGDVGIDLFEALLATRGVRDEAREALAAEARDLEVDAGGDANALAAALYDAYKADRYAHDRAFAMMAWVFAGWRRNELASLCEDVLRRGGIDARVRPALREILAWAARKGVEVYVVSASARIMVEVAVAGARLGIAPDHVAAMTPATSGDGVILPVLDGPIVYGEGKLAALERVRPGARGALLGAFGDSAYDAAMLRAARVPVAVTPVPALLALAPTIPGLVALDR